MISTVKAGVPVISKQSLIRKAGDLKVLPTVARKLMEQLSSEEASVPQLRDLIATDQALTSKVLKLANSSFYGLRGEVTDLQRTIVILGFDTLRRLVLSLSAQAMYRRLGLAEQKMWEHAVAVAVATRALAGTGVTAGHDMFFLAGLLHDVGKAVLCAETPELYAQVLNASYRGETPASLVEQELYGYSHAEIGAGVLEKWGLPEVMVRTVAYHHEWEANPGLKIADPMLLKAVAAVNLADHCARFHGLGYQAPRPEVDVCALRSAAELGLGPAALKQLLDRMPDDYEQQRGLFQ